MQSDQFVPSDVRFDFFRELNRLAKRFPEGVRIESFQKKSLIVPENGRIGHPDIRYGCARNIHD